MSPTDAYVLIAVPNLVKAATFRQAVADTLSLDAVTVRDGEELLRETSRRGWPAVLIVDLSLPRIDGFAVIRRLRRLIPEADTRVIAVAAHEALRTAARELAGPLAIAQVLSLDVERSVLATALGGVDRRPPEPEDTTTVNPSLVVSPPGIDDIIDRAAIEARRRCRARIGIGYARLGDHEHMTFHVSARESGPVAALGDVSDFRFLRQVAETSDPLVIPSVESHPVFAQFLLTETSTVRGFAAVPVPTSRENVRAALCVVDSKPSTLSPADIDALAAFGREVGEEIDQVLEAPRDRRPAGEGRGRTVDDEMKALQQLAATDPLTGLANRRGGEKHIANEISRAKRERIPLSCILLDVDRFKQVNDTYGHQAGDQLLREVSNVLRRAVRAYDIVVRWGGEEFLLVLPGVDLELALALAERIRVAVEELDTHGVGRVTISAGVATFENDYDFSSTLRTADRRLYQAKAAGRNRVV